MFIKLITSEATYYVNRDDINYCIIPSDLDEAFVVNCNRGHDIKIQQPIADTDDQKQAQNNKSKISDIIRFWITTTNNNNMIYINPLNVSVITKTDIYTVRFKNTAGLICENLNCRGNLAM